MQYIKSLKFNKIPQLYKDKLITFQRKFGSVPEELPLEDYAKYVEFQKIKERVGGDMDFTHPLLEEVQGKLRIPKPIPEEAEGIEALAAKAEDDYLNKGPAHLKEYRRDKWEKAKQAYDDLHEKLLRLKLKGKLGRNPYLREPED